MNDERDVLRYEAPAGYEVVGFWCFRGPHACDEACKSDSVPLMVQAGPWAQAVRRSIAEESA